MSPDGTRGRRCRQHSASLKGFTEHHGLGRRELRPSHFSSRTVTQFYFYAPKADPFLRKRWQEDHSGETADRLRSLAATCRRLGVRFGIGLSPFEVYRNFDRSSRAALARKLSFFADIGIDDLAILFDDMDGKEPDLAEKQATIVHWIAERMANARLLVCPTYYSDDPLLDRLFRRRPENYLEEFGARLDPSIDVFWTGEEVCSRQYSTGHLKRMCRLLGRKPVLWDNYPVNDGKRMSQHLHLRGSTGRPASAADLHCCTCHQSYASTGADPDRCGLAFASYHLGEAL